MGVRRFQRCDAFVTVDLDPVPGEAPFPSRGVVRAAPKVLLDGARLLARSITYGFASMGRRGSGASAGVNAAPEDRAAALAAFVDEVVGEVGSGALVLDAGRGVAPDALAPLFDADGRGPGAPTARSRAVAASVLAAADACGPLDGRRVAVEIVGDETPPILAGLAARGARLVALGSAAGTVQAAPGLDPAAAVEAVSSLGADAVAHLGRDADPPAALFGAEADVLLVGSRAGLVDHGVAAAIVAATLVPCGPVPVTAKALAVLRRSGVAVLPDFVALAGPLLVGPPAPPDAHEPADAADDDGVDDGRIADAVRAALEPVLGDPVGPLLGACVRAESHLATWRDALPFGRPLA